MAKRILTLGLVIALAWSSRLAYTQRVGPPQPLPAPVETNLAEASALPSDLCVTEPLSSTLLFHYAHLPVILRHHPLPPPGWIWDTSATATLYFRQSFEVHDTPVSATLQVGGAVSRTVYVNGRLAAQEDHTYAFLPTLVDITAFIQPGSNTIAFQASLPTTNACIAKSLERLPPHSTAPTSLYITHTSPLPLVGGAGGGAEPDPSRLTHPLLASPIKGEGLDPSRGESPEEPAGQLGKDRPACAAGHQETMGCSSSGYDQGAPGISAHVSIQTASRQSVDVSTDHTWRVSANAASGWTEPGFDDSAWTPAHVLRRWGDDTAGDAWEIHQAVWDVHGGAFRGPAEPLSPDLLVNYTWDAPAAGDPWQRVYVRPTAILSAAPASAFHGLESLLSSAPSVTVSGPGTLLLDFGREVAGWVELESPDLAATLVISASENTFPPSALGGTITRGYQRGQRRIYRMPVVTDYEGLYTGIRYAWLRFGPAEQPWHITGLYTSWQVKPANYAGRFACSDPDLTRSWYLGAYTVRLNFERDLINTILRPRGDRYPWGGDNRIAEWTALVAFGNYDFVNKDIHYWDDALRAPPPRSLNGIPSYTLHWILGVVNAFRYSGDYAGMNAQLDVLVSLLDEFEAYFDDPDQAGLNFIDFGGWGSNLGQEPSRPNVKRAYQLLYIQTLREMAWAMQQLGRHDLADQYNKWADGRSAQWRAANPDWTANAERHVVTNAILAGLPGEDEAKRLSEIGLAKPGQHVSVTPFFTYFILEALSRTGHHADALAAARTVWGGMNQMGATTHWESYLVEWPALFAPSMPQMWPKMSFCHPWSSGVTIWLSNEVLGIKPTAPGFSQYNIVPHLGDLSWVEGRLPTPRGPIEAAFRVSSDTLTATLELPPDSLGRIGIPLRDMRVQQVIVSSTQALAGRPYQPVGGVGSSYGDDDYLYLTGVRPGRYTILVRYDGQPVPPVQAAPGNIIIDDEDRQLEWNGPPDKIEAWRNLWLPDAYGFGFHLVQPGQADVRATFRPDLPRAGQYNVYAMWAEWPGAASQAPITITYQGGSQALIVNQQAGGGSTWNYLGTFPFEEGEEGCVTLSNLADGPVVVDAVRFEWIAAR